MKIYFRILILNFIVLLIFNSAVAQIQLKCGDFTIPIPKFKESPVASFDNKYAVISLLNPIYKSKNKVEIRIYSYREGNMNYMGQVYIITCDSNRLCGQRFSYAPWVLHPDWEPTIHDAPLSGNIKSIQIIKLNPKKDWEGVFETLIKNGLFTISTNPNSIKITETNPGLDCYAVLEIKINNHYRVVKFNSRSKNKVKEAKGLQRLLQVFSDNFDIDK